MENAQKEKWIFIVNPVAGSGYAGKLTSKLDEMVAKHALDAKIVFSERSGHVTELATYYADKGIKYIIGVGGDGTLNEIAAALLNKKDVVMGLIPAGTGNDFIQILGFPDRFSDEHWDIFFEKHFISMDAGVCNGKPFLNGMGLGFDAQVAAENYVESGEVKKGGKNKYLFQIIKTILLYKEKKMTVDSAELKDTTDCFINTVSIGRRFAGGFYLTPKAIANDGLLDVCMIKKLSVLERFGILPKVPKGTHLLNKKVHYYQTSGLKIKFEQKMPFHLDGELYYAKEFDVSIIPGAVKMFYNPKGKHFFKIS